MTIRLPGLWISQGRYVICVQGGAVLTPAPKGWSVPFRTRWALWLWTGLRPHDRRQRRHAAQCDERLKSVWTFGPLELVRWHPAPCHPDLYWRGQRERLLREEGVLV